MTPGRKRAFGIVNPQPYMRSALEALRLEYDIHILQPKSWDPDEIAQIVAYCRLNGIESVGGFAQKDALHHVLINAGLGNTVPSRLSILYGMNKFLMRTLEVDPFFFAPIDPMVETDEQIRAKIPDAEWPFMLKNTSLSLGRGIYRVRDYEHLKALLKSYREDKSLQELIAHQNRSILAGMDPSVQLPAVVPPLLAEHMECSDNIEYCYEGYVTPSGKIEHYGLTEEVYFANHQALGYVTPPLSLDASAAPQIEAWVEAYMSGFVRAGFLNHFFNIEFWMRPDGSIKLTEMNPRTADMFHFNYALSCGSSLYRDCLLLAAENYPLQTSTPFDAWKSNSRSMKYSMTVLITLTEAGRLSELLDYNYAEHLEKDKGLLVSRTKGPGDTISLAELTSDGVMAMQVWVTGQTRQELVAMEAEIRAKIYRRKQIGLEYPAYWK